MGELLTRRAAKPRGVSGATLLSFVGDEPPTSISAWKYTGLTGSVNCTVRFNGNPPPGTKVWIAAFWFSFRNERGPTSAPVSTHLCGLPALAKAA